MAKSLKINGMEELAALRNRTKRQYGRGGITQHDFTYILDRLNEIEARIVSMHEDSPDLPKGKFE